MKQSSAFARSFNSKVCLSLVFSLATAGAAFADQNTGILNNLHHHGILTSTVTDNGDVNPYAVIVAPVSAGAVQKNDVLIDNFNNVSNLQGTGTTIVDYSPVTKKVKLLAKLPQHLAQCPGGVGLSTAMTMLKTGWIIVGSTPSTDGTTQTKGAGCLIVLDSNGTFVNAWSGPNINDPWGNMAIVDNGSTATLFISMAGFDLKGPDVRDPATGNAVITRKAKVVRFNLAIADGKPPTIVDQTVVADGFGQQADRDNFLFGPTGVTLGRDNTLYVSDGLGNQIVKIADAMQRTTSAGTGETVTKGGLLHNPLSLIMAPNGDLLAVNGLNGQVVEIDPSAGKQMYAQWIDIDQAQSPPGNGDLFGLALKPGGNGFYFVEDDINALAEDTP